MILKLEEIFFQVMQLVALGTLQEKPRILLQAMTTEFSSASLQRMDW